MAAVTAGYLRPFLFTCAVGGSSYCLSSLYFNQWRRPRDSTRWSSASDSSAVIQKGTILGNALRRWINSPFHDKFFCSIVSINVVVWLSWKSKRLQPFLHKYFITSPAKSNSVSSLLFCTFSHIDVWHIAINMTVLWSFVPSFINIIGDQRALPFYITSGTFASMCGHYYKLIRGGCPIPSLGASGALLAIITLVIINKPESSLYIIFLPFIPIPSYMGLGAVVSFDILGVIKGWKLFDHAAHLGGVISAFLHYKWFSWRRKR